MKFKLGVSAFALAAVLGTFSSNAYASCSAGSIEVYEGGVERCVTPEEFNTLSDEVKATADPEDVEEAISGEDDETEETEDESAEDIEDDSAEDTEDDSAEDSEDDSEDDSAEDSEDDSVEDSSDHGSEDDSDND